MQAFLDCSCCDFTEFSRVRSDSIEMKLLVCVSFVMMLLISVVILPFLADISNWVFEVDYN